MRFAMILALALMTCPSALFTQQENAENGFYPANYNGLTFTGTTISTNDATREVTLTYTNPKKGKTQTLVCTLEDGYTVKLQDGASRELKPSDIKPGMVIKVYYIVGVKKVEGKKTQVNIIINIAHAPNTRAKYLTFKAYK